MVLTFSGHTLQTVFLQNWVIRQHPDLCRGCVHVRILKSFNRKAINSVEAYKMTSKSKPGNKSVQERSREHVSPTYAGQHFKMWQTDGQTDIKEWQTDRWENSISLYVRLLMQATQKWNKILESNPKLVMRIAFGCIFLAQINGYISELKRMYHKL